MSVTAEIPKKFGRYKIVKRLGTGGMGSVYLARDTQLERDIALKVPQFKEGRKPQILARFYQEARAAATIHHPNICPVYDVGEVDGVPYLTMAFIDGKSLAECLSAGIPLNERQIATIGRKVAEALNEAHEKGIIHRDLKPANIMIDRRGEPIVMDFGLARLPTEDDTRLTRMGAVFGSPAYMSPEQVRGETGTIGPSTDVFSLGVILYESLTRRLPFNGTSIGAVHAQILMDDPPPLGQFCPNLSPALDAICMKALAKKVDDRYTSMAQMAVVLRDFLSGLIAISQLPPTVEARLVSTPLPPSSHTKSTLRGSAFSGRSAVTESKVETKTQSKPPKRKRKLNKKRGLKKPAWMWFAGIGVFVLAVMVGFVSAMRPFDRKADTGATPGAEKSDTNNRIAPGGKESPPAKETGPKKETEFRSLFNGIDYKTDWEEGPGTAPLAWKVENGSLVSVGADPARPAPATVLLSRQEYSDYDLRFEFKTSIGGLSGVVPKPVSGLEMQIGIPVMHDSYQLFRQLPDPSQTLYTGALRFVGIEKQALMNPVGQWNSMQVWLKWPNVRVAVNSQETVMASLDSMKIQKLLGRPLPKTSKIGLVNNLGTVEYRNIIIMEMSAAGPIEGTQQKTRR